MKNRRTLLSLGLALIATLGAVVWAADAVPTQEQRDQYKKTFDAGNFKDAYEGYKAMALNKADDPRKVGEDLQMAINALQNLGRLDETDDFREDVIKLHSDNWRLLFAAAKSLQNTQHYGFKVAGKYYRGNKRGGGEYVSSFARDHVRALQLMQQALEIIEAGKGKEGEGAEKAEFFLALSDMLLSGRGYNEAWRLQVLTDLKELPDYEVGWGYNNGNSRGAPVDADGNPIFYKAPKRWQDAKNDGERWRWSLAEAAEMSADKLNETRWRLANFLQGQFGVQTMAEFGFFQSGDDGDPNHKDEAGPYAVNTLGEDETIARLATGIKRFKLPDEFNFIKIYQTIADNPKTGHGDHALEALAGIFTNRRQYNTAADYWKRAIKEYGPGQENYRQKALEQIVNNWGRFEPMMSQAAGKGASVDFSFRNGDHVAFEAYPIKLDKLLEDVKAYLKARPGNLDWQKINVDNIGYRLVEQNETQYLGEKTASWDMELKPLADHYDRRITVATPLQKAGAYLLKAQMKGGNLSRIIIWLNDTALVKKPLDGKQLYIAADAVTGKPLDKLNVEFIGYRVRWEQNPPHQEMDFLNFAEFTDAEGEIKLGQDRMATGYNWLAIGRSKDGRLASLGFSNVWFNPSYDQEYNATKVFSITDRPVYRPGQPVKYKFWVRHAKYDQENTSDFANKDFIVELHSPRGEKVLSKTIKADAYGGIDGEYALPSDAQLGNYNFVVLTAPNQGIGNGHFRVEEYKKPEFEVKVDAPDEPVMLGDKIKATIKAKYYFGAPVVKAKVHYTVKRTSYTETWYPIAPWDWFYGRGYWWFGYDYDWFPGFVEWGCRRPSPWWIGRGYSPPEVVADVEAAIGADGTVSVDIDTAVAKAVHPNQDHRYEITAEVVDESRRTIVGNGAVLVARKPFQVTVWLNRGYLRAPDNATAYFAAHTLDSKPVKGEGHLVLYKLSYDKNGKPLEKAVEEWNVDTNEVGEGHQQFRAAEPGQYRLSYKLTDAKKHTIEGGYVFIVTGPEFDGASFRFSDIELIPDKQQYEPGQKVKLMVNTNRTGAPVWLFLRPTNGVYQPPKLLQMDGKSTVFEIDVTKKDMPNFFVEALTIAGGKAFSEVKEIVVPPEQRVLDVAVKPSKDDYRPGQKAKITVTLTDTAGKPFVGSTALAVYDKAVEYISGGSNVAEIKSFFWKWRRGHYQNMETNLGRMFMNLLHSKETPMGVLGVFGNLESDVMLQGRNRNMEMAKGAGSGGTAFGRRGFSEQAAAPGAPMAAMAADGVALRKATGDNGVERELSADKPGAGGGIGGEPPPNLVQPTVRSKFADTALWVASLTTDEKGQAEVSLDMPENLTTWKVRVWGMGHGTKVGQGDADIITRKDLIVRLQAPRFFVEKDEVVLSANVHNYLKHKKQCQVTLDLGGGKELVNPADSTKQIELEAGGETRVDWRVKVAKEGEAKIRMQALTDEESDAVEQKFPVYVHGMNKMVAFSGALRPKDESGKIELTVPKERREGESLLELRYSPTLAGAMVDALPYLADYPYGCTEQTLNRFVPTVITQRILIKMGLDLKKIKDKHTNLNAQEIGDDAERQKQWAREHADGKDHTKHNPVFDNEEVTKMSKDGVQRLTEMQNGDGGWGWFSGFGEQSWPHTTAVVVHGLQVAKQNDVAIVPGVLEKGTAWLKQYQDRQVEMLNNAKTKTQPYKTQADNLDAFVYMVLVDGGVDNVPMRDYLYRDRIQLSVYAKAMFGLALFKQKDQEKLAMILKNIEQFLQQDDENQTAFLKLPEDNYWWTWYGSEIEADSYYLKLLTRTDPKGEVAPKLVKYLLNNRKHASYWNSTRDTSLAIEAMAEYLQASGEDKPDITVEVVLDGKPQKEVKITAADLFVFDNKFVVKGDGVTTGKHTLEVRKKGSGPLYYNAYLSYFTLEDHIAKAGLEIKVNRQVYKLTRDDKTIQVSGSRGQVVNQRTEKYRRTELKDNDQLKSGDLVEVELEIDSKNDYEYLVFEDMKAAGFEAVEVRSGYGGNAMGAYMELHDNRTSFFVRQIARGKHSVAYRLRAEVPGRFSALPAKGWAMYAPELRANSDEIKLRIED